MNDAEMTLTDGLLDRPRRVREGEELDLDALAAWLRTETRLLDDAAASVEILQFPSGYSNLTYMLRLGETEVVLRRPPFGNTVKTGHDMSREYSVLSKLAPVYALAPKPLASCEDEAVLGAPFYLMERRRGIIIRRKPPRGMTIDEPTARALSLALIDGLAELHAIDWRGIGLGDFGRPEGYARRQVEGWTRRWDRAKTDEVPKLDAVAKWLAETLPADADADPALIHNDYKYDNVLLALPEAEPEAEPEAGTQREAPVRINAVLDWEMATIGSPRMDLGTTLGYWVEAGDDPRLQGLAFGPTNLPGSLTRAELIERYQERSGIELSSGVYYRVFGLFKIAAIVQQIYARYRKGSTQDPRFAALGYFVTMLAEVAAEAIEQG
ncbi:putative aminoglycoside phosphotransferase [Enhygromyxa salina]|uniref:Putative aminoglycoside phosphotransferase n=1 Tax=Enhygromyxa salina TaxID=215803 RepID=A0A2S9XET6_9BACT|nr:phosphotransferase family protein [Enhygromyxa salina]PRP91357.1 putative aminoglycoside phosphotransferase [Enhygromyxa salina]